MTLGAPISIDMPEIFLNVFDISGSRHTALDSKTILEAMSDRAASRSRSPCRETTASSPNLVDALIARTQKETISSLEAIIQCKNEYISTLEEDKRRLKLHVQDLDSEMRMKTAELERKLWTANLRLDTAQMTEDLFRRHLNMPPREESSRRCVALRVSVDPVEGSSR